MRWIDIPPVWLFAFAYAAWAIGWSDPYGLSFGRVLSGLIGAFGIGGGLIMMALAVMEMRKWRTTVIPHREADHLVTSGIFKRTRNPIYVGDALILLGVVFWFDVPLALPLLPVFVWWIERHFILAEEDRLRRKFRTVWARYERDTRRWF